MLTDFVFLQPRVHILDDVCLTLQLVDEALQLGEVSRVVHRLHSGELRRAGWRVAYLEVKLTQLSVRGEIFLVSEIPAGELRLGVQHPLRPELHLELADAEHPEAEETETGEEDQHLDRPEDQLLRDPAEQSGDDPQLGLVGRLARLLSLSVTGAHQAAAATVTVSLNPPLVQCQQGYEPGHLQ